MKKAVISKYVTETNMIAFRHKIRKMLDQQFFGYYLAIFFTMFLTKVQTVHLSEQLANVIKIPEEHLKTT